MASTNRIHWVTDELTPGLGQFSGRMFGALKLFFQYQESKVQDHMRNTALWTDRTGNARQGLFAKAYGDGRNKTQGIICYHTMPYGIWLEVKNEGQFAVINPTIQLEGRRIMGELNTLLSKMKAVQTVDL